MKITKLKDHSLLKCASAVSRTYMAKCKPDLSNADIVASKKENYGIEVMLSISNIVVCLDQLHFAVDMLAGFRTNLAPAGMNRYDHIVFAIENYYLRITSVFDRSLRLANTVFQLGLPEKQCNRGSIIRNSHLKGTLVAESLKKLDDFTGDFRSHRNTVAHEATYSEMELDKIATYYALADEDDSFERFNIFYKTQANAIVASKKSEFSDNVTAIESLVTDYFDALLPQFSSKVNEYI